MAGIPNKIIINSKAIRAYLEIVTGWLLGILWVFKGAKKQAKEIKKLGFDRKPEAKTLLTRQEEICEKFDAACEQYVDALRECHREEMTLANDMRLWIEQERANKP